jgi:hypothetical protein
VVVRHSKRNQDVLVVSLFEEFRVDGVAAASFGGVVDVFVDEIEILFHI